jgi:hypothetical protein
MGDAGFFPSAVARTQIIAAPTGPRHMNPARRRPRHKSPARRRPHRMTSAPPPPLLPGSAPLELAAIRLLHLFTFIPIPMLSESVLAATPYPQLPCLRDSAAAASSPYLQHPSIAGGVNGAVCGRVVSAASTASLHRPHLRD